MTNKLLLAVVATAVGFGSCFFARALRYSERPARLAVDMIAPDFSLSEITGGQLQLSAYRGKVILLDFWATWCDACREEIPHFIQLQEKYRDRGLQIIGVSMDDTPEPVRSYYERFKINYPVVMGNANIGELYGGVLGLPVAFVIRRDGRIYRKHNSATEISVFEHDIVRLLQNGNGGQTYLPLIDRKFRLHAVVPMRGKRQRSCDHVDADGESCSGSHARMILWEWSWAF